MHAGDTYTFGAFTGTGKRDIVFTTDNMHLQLPPEIASSGRLYGSIGPGARIAITYWNIKLKPSARYTYRSVRNRALRRVFLTRSR